MSELIQQVIGLLCTVVIVVRAESVLNRMNRQTPLLVRTAFHLLTVGAAAEIVCIVSGDAPSWSMVIVAAGVAMLLLCERRLQVFSPPSRQQMP